MHWNTFLACKITRSSRSRHTQVQWKCHHRNLQLFPPFPHNPTNRHTSADQQAGGKIGLYKLGYEEGDISSHSLRASGAMAMHLTGINPNTIPEMGQWKSNNFLMYIHEQMSAFATGISVKMSNAIPFRHIAGPSITVTA